MIFDTLKIIFIIFEVLLIFNLLVVVHELGHFLAARWRGLVIEGFGIWFGKPIWKKKINGVTYSLGSIPAGGFVKLPQMAPMEAIEGGSEHKNLPVVRPLDKIIVAFAGPLFSIGLALVFALLVWKIGRPVTEAEKSTTIGYVLEDSPAAKAGLQAGDTILKVDGRPVSRFGGMGDSIQWYIIRSEGETIPVEYSRKGVINSVNVAPIIPENGKWWKRRGLREIQIAPKASPLVAKVQQGSLAEKAGFKENDVLTHINGEAIYNFSWLSDYLEKQPGGTHELTVQRGTETRKIAFEFPMPSIGTVFTNSPAALAGIKAGDAVTAVNGQPLATPTQLIKYIKTHGTEPLMLTINRGGKTFDATVTPMIPKNDTEPRIGIGWAPLFGGIAFDELGLETLDYPNPWEQIRDSVVNMVHMVDALFSPKSNIGAQHMSGPVMIFRIYYFFFQSEMAWQRVLWFSVLLNVNLALFNLLPIPVLDGGHITLALIEWIRRRPVNIRVLEVVQGTCAMLLIGYMLYVTFFDVMDLNLPFQKEEAMQFEPAPSK